MKVILTKEQMEAVKLYKMNGIGLKTFFLHSNEWNGVLASLKTLTIDEMARALYEPDSFEIEQPKIRVGDWVVNKVGFAFKVDGVFPTYATVKGLDGHRGHIPLNSPDIRLATKEEAFWAELGREVGEFRDDDLLIDNENHVWSVDTSNSTGVSSKGMYLARELKGFYLPESFKPFPTGNE